MNAQQTNASDGRVTRATGDIAMNTKTTKQGQSIADGFRLGRLPRLLSSILPSLRSFVANFVDKAPDKARDKDGGTVHRPLFTVHCLLLTLLLGAGTAYGQLSTDGSIIRRYRENGTNYYAHIFTNSATLTLSGFSGSTNVDYLVVAGGGGGGGGTFNGGGGGAGGVRFGRTNMTAGTAYTITVGAGGVGCPINSGAPYGGTNGYPSSISGADVTVNTTGGGRGCSVNMVVGANGGSGGGNAWNQGSGSAVGGGELGNNGGTSSGGGTGGGGGARLGGGGGSEGNPGAGGAGTNLSYSGVTVEYARGGNGVGSWSPYVQGQNGAPNTGNGGGGSANDYNGARVQTLNGGNGGSGIVIVRYADASAFSATVTVSSATARWPFEVGAFTISRPADLTTNYEMTVTYTLTGTATNGVDYAAAPATNNLNIVGVSSNVTFGVGVTSIVVNLYPLYNPLTVARTATLTLAADGNPAADVTFPAWNVGKVVTAVGGTVTNYPYGGGTNWAAHIFTNVVGSANFTITSGGQVEYLVVAGGGGGGGGAFSGAGGGAGGVRLGALTLPAGTYTIIVGDGGVGCPINGGSPVGGTNGYPSVIGGSNGIVVVNTTGGGRGASTTGGAPFYPGLNGGSGGGGVWSASSDRGLAVGGGELGNNGGLRQDNGNRAAGGGGARTAGQDASAGNAGGSGTNLSFSGVSVVYAAGGEGAPSWAVYQGTTGADNTGNGGGGSANDNSPQTKNGGDGGSGIVIVRYVIPPPPKGTLFIMR